MVKIRYKFWTLSPTRFYGHFWYNLLFSFREDAFDKLSWIKQNTQFIYTKLFFCLIFFAIIKQKFLIFCRLIILEPIKIYKFKFWWRSCLNCYAERTFPNLFDVHTWSYVHVLLINLLKTKRRLLYLKTQSVPRCNHFSSRL